MSETLMLPPTEYEVHDTVPSDIDQPVYNITTLGEADPGTEQAEFLHSPGQEGNEQTADEPMAEGAAERNTYSFASAETYGMPGHNAVAANLGHAMLLNVLSGATSEGLARLRERPAPIEQERAPEKQNPSDRQIIEGLTNDLIVDVSNEDPAARLSQEQSYGLASRLYHTLNVLPGGKEKISALDAFVKDKDALHQDLSNWANEGEWIKWAQSAVIELIGGMPSLANRQLILDATPKYYAYNSANLEPGESPWNERGTHLSMAGHQRLMALKMQELRKKYNLAV